MITKELCDINKCPLVPPNCKMFFLTPNDCPDKSDEMVNAIYFSPRDYDAESIKWWSHDADFPVRISESRGGMREIIGAVAMLCWGAKMIEPTTDSVEFIRTMDAWNKWLVDPDEDEEDDDDDLPPVFKQEVSQ